MVPGRAEVGRIPGDLRGQVYFFTWREEVEGEEGKQGFTASYSPGGRRRGKHFSTRRKRQDGNKAYEARQRAHVARLDLQRLVEEVVGKVLLRHVLHGVQVLKELLLQTHTHTHQNHWYSHMREELVRWFM